MKKLLLFFVMLIVNHVVFCQDLDSHLWENRKITVYINSEYNTEYLTQVTELKNNIKGVIDRRIIIYFFQKKIIQ